MVDRAEQAAAARADLEQTLLRCAEILIETANALNAVGSELAQKAQKDAEMAAAYVAELERRVSQQQNVS